MIKVIVVGTLKEDYLKLAQRGYLKRLSKYNKVEIIEIKEKSIFNKEEELKKEAIEINNHINKNDYIICLDLDGIEYNTNDLTNKLKNIFDYNSNICFIIGGSVGLDESIKNISKLRLSFSKLTFPHNLFRIIFLEQIYRTYKIINNETYDK